MENPVSIPIFSNRSIYMNLITGRNTPAFAKDTVYRFMKMIQINRMQKWTKEALVTNAENCPRKKEHLPCLRFWKLLKKQQSLRNMFSLTAIFPLNHFPRNLFFYLFSLPYCYLCLHPS